MAQESTATTGSETEPKRKSTAGSMLPTLETQCITSDPEIFSLAEFPKKDFQIDNRGSDLIITCQNRKYHVHTKNVIQNYLSKSVESSSALQRYETEADLPLVISFDEEDPLAVWLMLSHCYAYGNWGPAKELSEHGFVGLSLEERLRRTVLAFAIADEYLFLELKRMMVSAFENLMEDLFWKVQAEEAFYLNIPIYERFIPTLGKAIAHIMEFSGRDDRLRYSALHRKSLTRSKTSGNTWHDSSTPILDFDHARPSCDKIVRMNLTSYLVSQTPFECPDCGASHKIEQWNHRFSIQSGSHGHAPENKEAGVLPTCGE
ncbi:hypothetical protein IWX90DRAFT_495534 [Phyllosticta citrichinensis]|uniref:BTB domain-containing protein n=1 Tax=Phyllosticta citrichinensis TaxID=1130410 RepID=A0ABR1XFT3_9PEZI